LLQSKFINPLFCDAVLEVILELTERQIFILRRLAERPTIDIPAAIVHEHIEKLIHVGYIAASNVDDRSLYEITHDGRAALERSGGG
jgi:predicted transcriptional regulator